MNTPILSIEQLLNLYRQGILTPREFVAQQREKIEVHKGTNPVWIHLLDEAELEPYLQVLESTQTDDLPLYGVPFAIKDNLDLAGVTTTAGCPEFTYMPEESAFVVDKLIAAGAIPIGKTNLDQFATGLVGARSPWGACHSVFSDEHVSGGSSSGSAVAVAEGLVLFSLGTDTAGSGRIPAAFNNLVGMKPSRGVLSNRGMVRACRSLDCVSIFALTGVDAKRVFDVAQGYDAEDEFSRAYQAGPAPNLDQLRVAVPYEDQLEFFGDQSYQKAHAQALKQAESLGWNLIETDFSPLFEAARLLYEGPWVAERDAAYGEFARANPDAVLPVIHEILKPAATFSATQTFSFQYRMQEIRQIAAEMFANFDFALVPSAPGHYRLEDVAAEPIRWNSQLGTYTNFVNLLDLAAIALPAGFTDAEMPYGITLIAGAFQDEWLLRIASAWQARTGLELGKRLGKLSGPEAEIPPAQSQPEGWSELLVCGAHMSGLPLNHQLRTLGAVLAESTRTAPAYSLYALAGGPPHRPGLVRDTSSEASIEVEVWHLPTQALGALLEQIPNPLGLGKVELEDGRWVNGFICEPCGITNAEEITHLGTWRNYQAG